MRQFAALIVFCLVSVAGWPLQATAATTLYGLGLDGSLYRVDTANPQKISLIGSLGVAIAAYDRSSLAFNPSDKQIYAVARRKGTTADFDLIRISPTTGAAQVIASLPYGKYEGMGFSTSLNSLIVSHSTGGDLDFTAGIYKLSAQGELSLIVTNNMDNDTIVWDSDKNSLYSSDPNGDGALVRVDLQSGTNSRIMPVSPDLVSMTYNPGDHLIYGTLQPENALTVTLVTLNPVTGENKNLGLIGSPVADVIFASEEAVQTPTIRSGGITDAASGSISIAQGALFSIWGTNLAPATVGTPSLPLPFDLSGVSVDVIDGSQVLRAGILYVSEGQINAQMPFALSGGPVQVRVNTSTGNSTAVQTAISARAASFYTKTADGKGEAILLHSNYSLVSQQSPAMPGEIVLAYVNGLGVTDPVLNVGQVGGDGLSSPLNYVRETVKIEVGGKAADVLFAGMAPGFLAYQVNFRIPGDATPGLQPLTIAAGQGSSPSGVTTYIGN